MKIKTQSSKQGKSIKSESPLKHSSKPAVNVMVQPKLQSFFRPKTQLYAAADAEMERFYAEKRCETCHKGSEIALLFVCPTCDDAFHAKCMAWTDGQPDDDWMCAVCQADSALRISHDATTPSPQSIYPTNLKRVCSSAWASSAHSVSNIPSAPKTVQIQPDLKKYFASSSIKTETPSDQKSDSRVVDSIDPVIKKDVPVVEIDMSAYHPSLHILLKQYPPIDSDVIRKPKRRGAKLTVTTKKSTPLKLPRYLDLDSLQNLKQRCALASAMQSKQMQFDDEQSYPFHDCPQSANAPHDLKLEPRMQKLDAASVKVFHESKLRSALGDYGNVCVVLDEKQGWVVEATGNIPAYTLICEYTGEVDYTRHHLFDGDDDIMDLIRSGRSRTSLVMCPSHRGNIGRFLSGVNNFTADGIKQVNTRSARFVIDGRSRVLLFTKRAVKAGERLYYDYNALAKGYATESFV